MSYSLAFSQAVLTAVFVADKVRLGIFDFVPTKEISEALNIPAPSAVKILQGLNRAGIIETREGAKGGVRLARPASKISVADLLDAVEHNRSLFRTDFNVHVAGDRPTRVQKVLRAVLETSEQAMKAQLQQVSIQDVIDRAER